MSKFICFFPFPADLISRDRKAHDLCYTMAANLECIGVECINDTVELESCGHKMDKEGKTIFVTKINPSLIPLPRVNFNSLLRIRRHSPPDGDNLKLYVVGHSREGRNDCIALKDCNSIRTEVYALFLSDLARLLNAYFDLTIFREIKLITCYGDRSGSSLSDSIAGQLWRELSTNYGIRVPVIGYRGDVIHTFPTIPTTHYRNYSDKNRSRFVYTVGTIPDGEPRKVVYGHLLRKVKGDFFTDDLRDIPLSSNGTCAAMDCSGAASDKHCTYCGRQFCRDHLYEAIKPNGEACYVCIDCEYRFNTAARIRSSIGSLRGLKKTISSLLDSYITPWKLAALGHHYNDRAIRLKSDIGGMIIIDEIQTRLEDERQFVRNITLQPEPHGNYYKILTTALSETEKISSAREVPARRQPSRDDGPPYGLGGGGGGGGSGRSTPPPGILGGIL